MANRYWVGGTGSWSDDDNHWATSSGGTPANGNLPTPNDDVFIDKNSGFGSGGTINTNIPIFINTFNITTTHTIQIGGLTAYQNWDIKNGFVLTANITIKSSSLNLFGGDIDFGGASIQAVNGIGFYNNGTGDGDCRLLSDIDENIYSLEYFSGVNIMIGSYLNGFLDANDHNIKAHIISLDKGECYMGSGTWECWSLRYGGGGSMTLHSETSTLKILPVYDEYEEMNSYFEIQLWESSEPTFYNIWITGAGSSQLNIRGNFTCNEFKTDNAPKSLVFVGGKTITVNSFIATGSSGNLITINSIKSGGSVTSYSINNGGSGYAVDDEILVTGGNEDFYLYVTEVDESGVVLAVEDDGGGSGYITANNVVTSEGSGTGLTIDIVANEITSKFKFSKSSGIVECDYLDISNSNATGGATWYAGVESTDSGGNTGWIFASLGNSERTLYLRGQDTANSERGLYSNGFSHSSSERSLYTIGKSVSSSERGLYSNGFSHSSSERSLYTIGKSVSSSERGLYTTGSAFSGSERNIYTKSNGLSSSGRNLYTKGISTDSSDRKIFSIGSLSVSNERSLYIKGVDSNAESRNLYTIGVLSGFSEKLLYTKGFSFGSFAVGIYTKGSQSGDSERSLYTLAGIRESSEAGLYTKCTWRPWVDEKASGINNFTRKL